MEGTGCGTHRPTECLVVIKRRNRAREKGEDEHVLHHAYGGAR